MSLLLKQLLVSLSCTAGSERRNSKLVLIWGELAQVLMGGDLAHCSIKVSGFCMVANRVAKYHGYGRYIRVKNWKVGVKSLGEYTVLQNQVLFWVNVSN